MSCPSIGCGLAGLSSPLPPLRDGGVGVVAWSVGLLGGQKLPSVVAVCPLESFLTFP